MEIKNNQDLTETLNEMILQFPNCIRPREIGICESLAKYNNEITSFHIYKNIPVIIYKQWFANGKIIIT